MSIKEALARSNEWLTQSHALIDTLKFISSNRLRIAASLQHLSLEHHIGIYTLVAGKLIGSAFSLYRLQFEAYVRGAWILLAATDNQIDKFIKTDELPRFGEMVDALEMHEGLQEGYLNKIKKAGWKNLNSLTHGGIVQINARNTTDEITLAYKEEHIISLLDSSSTLSLLAAVALSQIAQSNETATTLYNEYLRIYKN